MSLKSLEQRFAEIQRRMWRLESSPGPMFVRLPIIGIRLPTPKTNVQRLTCVQSLGKELEGALSGLTLCAGCYRVKFDNAPIHFDLSFAWVDSPNGVFPLTFTGGSWENTNIGTVAASRFASDDETCTGLEETVNADVGITVQCSGRFFTIIISALASFTAGGVILQFYQNIFTRPYTLDEPMPNNLQNFGPCGQGGLLTVDIAATLGNLTLSRP